MVQHMKKVALDIETTGLDQQNDALIEIAIITFTDEKITDRWSSLINPGRAIPQIVSNLTGITDTDLKNAPFLKEIQPIIEEKLKDALIVGHFISFDVGFLKAQGVTVAENLLDTYDLARVLLPEEPSYSLEVLTEKWKVEQTQKHRALADAEASLNLLHLLTKKITHISQEKHEKIREILTKSTWEWKTHFLENLKNKTETTPFKKTTKEKMESPSSVVAYPTLPKNTENTFLNPFEYLCEKHCNFYYKKPILNNPETTLALKIALWKDDQTIPQKTLFLPIKEEKEIWNAISSHDISCSVDCIPEKCGWQNAQKIQRNIHNSTCTHATLLRELSRENSPLFQKERQIKIMEAELLEETIKYAFTEGITQENLTRFLETTDPLKEKIELFWGLLGLLVEKEGTHDGWSKKLPLNENLHENKHWNDAHVIFTQIIMLFREKFAQKTPATGMTIALGYELRKLHHALTDNKTKTVHIEHIENTIIIKITSNNIEESIQKLWNHPGGIFLESDILTDGIDAALVRKKCFIPDQIALQNHAKETPLSCAFTTKKIETLIEEYETVIVIAPSKALQEKIFHEIIEKMPKETLLISPHLTGGKGKIIQQWDTTTKKKKVLCAPMHWFLHSGEEMEIKTTKNCLVITGIPFIPSQEGFKEYTLPKAILTLKTALKKFRTMTQNRGEVFFTDQRINNYGQEIIKNLPPVGKWERICS